MYLSRYIGLTRSTRESFTISSMLMTMQNSRHRGLVAARAYSEIAPSAPHALHMPSHIFTRLGLWEDSIACNLAARKAAHQQGDTGEELHAMDYLVYAYLQSGREKEAAQVVQQLKDMSNLKRR